MMVIRENMFGETIVQRDILFKNSLTEYDLTNPINTILIGGKYEAVLECYNKEKPDIYVEIGCYRLNTSINLLKSHMPKKTYLLDLFCKAADFEVPPEQAPLSLSEASDLILKTFGEEPDISLIKGFTGASLPHVIQQINDQNNNTFIFVDGGHSYITVIRDLINISMIKNKLTVVIDDADWSEIDVAIKDFMKICHYRNPVIEYLKPNLCVINCNFQ